MKKLSCVLLVAVMVATLFCAPVSAVASTGKIYVDLVEVETDTPAQIINSRTMVPVRAITEMIGYDVYWHADKQQVDVCEKGSKVPVIIMQINSENAYYSKYVEEFGEYVGVNIVLDSPATIINDRTFVPLRFVSEAVGYVVEYIEETRDVHLFSPRYIADHQGEDKGGEPGGTGDDGIGEAPEGIYDDGIGEVTSLTQGEMSYVLAQTTETWLSMSLDEKNAMVVLIGRWWEDYENIVVEDYDDMVYVIDRQMEQYHKNGVDEKLFTTVCDIYEVDENLYVAE